MRSMGHHPRLARIAEGEAYGVPKRPPSHSLPSELNPISEYIVALAGRRFDERGADS